MKHDLFRGFAVFALVVAAMIAESSLFRDPAVADTTVSGVTVSVTSDHAAGPAALPDLVVTDTADVVLGTVADPDISTTSDPDAAASPAALAAAANQRCTHRSIALSGQIPSSQSDPGGGLDANWRERADRYWTDHRYRDRAKILT